MLATAGADLADLSEDNLCVLFKSQIQSSRNYFYVLLSEKMIQSRSYCITSHPYVTLAAKHVAAIYEKCRCY